MLIPPRMQAGCRRRQVVEVAGTTTDFRPYAAYGTDGARRAAHTAAMNLPLHVVLAAAALAWGGLLTAGHAQGARNEFTATAAEASAYRNLRGVVKPGAQAVRAGTVRERQEGFNRLCEVKPVMSDADLAGCRRAFEIY